MINYFNFQKFKNKYLITNDLGRYDFLDVSQFVKLLTDDIPADSEDGKRLREKYFIYDGDEEQFTRTAAFEMFNSKNYLFKSTSLHIFVLTSACNQSCVYCQAQSGNNCSKGLMSKEAAEKKDRPHPLRMSDGCRSPVRGLHGLSHEQDRDR